jgi:hypothetical protein
MLAGELRTLNLLINKEIKVMLLWNGALENLLAMFLH